MKFAAFETTAGGKKDDKSPAIRRRNGWPVTGASPTHWSGESSQRTCCLS